MATQNVFIEYFRNQALGNIRHSHSNEQALQTVHGFHKRLPLKKGYGIGGLFGSLALRFILLLKPLTWAAGRHVLCMGAKFACEYADGKSVGEAATNGIRELGCRHKERKHCAQPIIPEKRRCWHQDYLSNNDVSPYKYI